MAAPTIDPSRAAAAAVLGIDFEFQPLATGAASWSGRYIIEADGSAWQSGAPPGLTLRDTDGRLSGKPTTAGRYLVEFTPTNSDGDGEPYFLGLEVVAANEAPSNMALWLKWDIDSSRVTSNGEDLSDWYSNRESEAPTAYTGPRILLGAPGTVRDISLAVERSASGEPVPVSNVAMRIAPTPTDSASLLHDDAVTVDGTLSGTRYRFPIDLTAPAIAALISNVSADLVAQLVIESPDQSASTAPTVDETKSVSVSVADTFYPKSFDLPCTQAGTYLLRIQCLTSNYDLCDYTLAVRLESAGSGLTIASRDIAEVGDLTSPSEAKFFDSDTDSGNVLIVTSNPLSDTITWASGILTVTIQAKVTGTPFNPSMKASLAAKSISPTDNPVHSDLFPVRIIKALA